MVVVDDVRVRGIGRTPLAQRPRIPTVGAGQETPLARQHASCYWDGLGRVDTPVHMLAELKAGHKVEGIEIQGS